MKRTPRRRAWDIFTLERLLINIEVKSFSREAVFTARTQGLNVATLPLLGIINTGTYPNNTDCQPAITTPREYKRSPLRHST